jgi:hypothetical protein
MMPIHKVVFCGVGVNIMVMFLMSRFPIVLGLHVQQERNLGLSCPGKEKKVNKC